MMMMTHQMIHQVGSMRNAFFSSRHFMKSSNFRDESIEATHTTRTMQETLIKYSKDCLKCFLQSVGRQLKSENRLDADVEEEIFELTGTPVSRTGGHQTEINFHQRYLVMLLQRYRYHMLTGSVTHII